MAANGKRSEQNGSGGDRPAADPAPASSNGKSHAAEDDGDKVASSAPDDADEHVERSAAAEGEAEEKAAEGAAPTAPPAAHAAPPEARKGARWAEPIFRFDAKWTWFEARLVTFVLVWQLAALVSWVILRGLSESVGKSAGAVFCAALFCVGFGLTAWFANKRLGESQRRTTVTLIAVAVGLTIALLWWWNVRAVLAFTKPESGAKPGPDPGAFAFKLSRLDESIKNYFDNIKGWLQGGSTLTLMGGLRGLGTRLTLWLALLGGSLATGAGKHIHIDVVFRFLPKKLRVPAAIINYSAAALVCLAGAWGFFDHMAIEYYGSHADDARGAKIANAAHHIGDHLFFTRKQLGLDLRSFPHVLKGERYDRWMTAAEWNEWLDGAGFEGRFPADQVAPLRVPPDAGTHPPLVLSPDGENTSGMLAHTLALVFPFGLLAIALRFILRALLTLSGHLSPDPDEAHREDLGGAAANDGGSAPMPPAAKGGA